MKLKSILVTGAAVSLLTPAFISNGNNHSITVQAASNHGKSYFKQARANRFDNKWHPGFYDANISDPINNPVLLFTSLKDAKQFDQLSNKMGTAKKNTTAIVKQFNQLKAKATKFNDPTKQVQVKMTDKNYQAVKLDGKIYYATGGHNSGLSPFNVQYTKKSRMIESPLDPTAKRSHFVAKKGHNITIQKGTKWVGPHTWEYNGHKWVHNHHVSFK